MSPLILKRGSSWRRLWRWQDENYDVVLAMTLWSAAFSVAGRAETLSLDVDITRAVDGDWYLSARPSLRSFE